MINEKAILNLDQATLAKMYISSQELNEEYKKLNEEYKKINEEQQAQIDLLNAKYEKLVRMLYGRKSERFTSTPSDQLSLFNAPSEDKPEETPETEVVSFNRKKRTKSEHKGRQLLQNAQHIERRRTVIEPDVDTTNMEYIGEEVTSKLVFVDMELYIEETVRPKYKEIVAPAQESSSIEPEITKRDLRVDEPPNTKIHIADLPTTPFAQTIADVSLIVYLIVSKYVDHLPLYRLIEIFKRKKLKIPPATMNGWVHSGIKLLAPLYNALLKDVLIVGYLQVDETTIRVLEKFIKKRKSHLGYYWVYHSPVNKAIIFDYQKGRDQSGPMKLLSGFEGILQCDGYEVYAAIEKKNNGISLIHCMAHARRKFEEALSNNKEKSTYVLEQMQILYRVERLIREYKLADERITALRQRFSKPVLQQLGIWMKEELKTALPSSSFGKALAYSVSRWKKLCAYIDDPRLQIDNNLIENKIRPVAIGRKNYLFAGSHSAAQQAAMIYSLLATCKLNDVDPTEWLTDVFHRIQDHPINRIDELLPYNWTPSTD